MSRDDVGDEVLLVEDEDVVESEELLLEVLDVFEEFSVGAVLSLLESVTESPLSAIGLVEVDLPELLPKFPDLFPLDV